MTKVADHSDLDFMVKCAKFFHEKSPLSGFKFSPQGSRSYLMSIMKNPDSIIFVNDSGAIAGIKQHLPFCDAYVSKELFWYSNDGRDGIKLLGAYLKWVDDCDIDLFTTLVGDNMADEKVVAYLARKGFSVIEKTMVRGL